MTSDEAKKLLKERHGLDRDQADRFLRESAASYILRSWNEVADLWMRYIIYSKEAPLGKMEYAWYRKEFQGKEFTNVLATCVHDMEILTIIASFTRETREPFAYPRNTANHV